VLDFGKSRIGRRWSHFSTTLRNASALSVDAAKVRIGVRFGVGGGPAGGDRT
jgi:hypothetical protein